MNRVGVYRWQSVAKKCLGLKPELQMIDLTGVTVRGYTFEKILGGGGYATVYQAKKLDGYEVIDRVAVKAFIGDWEDRKKLRRTKDSSINEVKALVKLSKGTEGQGILQYKHSCPVNLVCTTSPGGELSVVDVDGDEGTGTTSSHVAFLVEMELADGGSFDQDQFQEVLEGEESQWQDYFLQIAKALRHAHRKRIIHRDIKPANLFYFKKTNQAKMGDFNIAFDRSGFDFEAALAGTPAYMAPELFDGAKNNEASDIYALGCTFYELLVGCKPFEISDSDAELPALYKIEKYKSLHRSSHRPYVLKERFGGVSFRLNYIMERMIAVDPGFRPGIDDVIDALEYEIASRRSSHPIAYCSIDREIPNQPIYAVSKRIVNPQFRSSILGQFCYFMKVSLPARDDSVVLEFAQKLFRWFGDSHSVFEVFGDCTYLVKIWAHEDCHYLNSFLEELKKWIGTKVEVMICDRARFLFGDSKSLNIKGDVVATLAKICRVQWENHPKSESKRPPGNPGRALYNQGVLLKSTAQLKKEGIKCFCFVHTNERETSDKDLYSEHQHLVLAIRNAASVANNFYQLALHSRRFQTFPDHTNIMANHLISYSVKNYEDAVKIPGLVKNEVRDFEFKTLTLLSTLRYALDSQLINPDLAVNNYQKSGTTAGRIGQQETVRLHDSSELGQQDTE